MKRVFRSWVGAIVSTGEDPKLILEQNRRDMQDKLPEINTALARARGGLARLEKEQDAMQTERDKTTEQLKTALRSGDDASALPVAEKLQQSKAELARLEARIRAAKEGCDKLRAFKESFKREMERKNSEADLAVREAEASKWKPQVAEAFQAFEVADLSHTHDEMVGKLTQETSLAEGKLDLAQTSADSRAKLKEAEKKYEEIQAQEILKEFKQELGLGEERPLPLEPMTDADSGPAKN
jgi:phage shock protein A